MQNKLDEQANLPNTLHNIVAITVHLQASLPSDKSQDWTKPSQINPSKSKLFNTQTPVKTGEKDGNTKFPQKKSTDFTKTDKNCKLFKQQECCFKYNQNSYIKFNCSAKTE